MRRRRDGGCGEIVRGILHCGFLPARMSITAPAPIVSRLTARDGSERRFQGTVVDQVSVVGSEISAALTKKKDCGERAWGRGFCVRGGRRGLRLNDSLSPDRCR